MAIASAIKGERLAKADNGKRGFMHNGEKYMKKGTNDTILLYGEALPGEPSDNKEFACFEDIVLECDDCSYYPNEYVRPRCICSHTFPYSRHRDGSIYKDGWAWKKEYHIANRDETRIEAMMLSDPKDCTLFKGTCMKHSPGSMLQILSLKLAKVLVDGGPVELYGYIASRDVLDPLLNYVVNVSRNDPIIVEQGSLIEMTGPKRGIELVDTTLIEYDMRIKTGKEEKDDLQLIDGVSFVDDRSTKSTYAFTKRINGDCGAVDITVSRLDFAVESTIEIYISEVRSNFNLFVGCFTSGLCEEIQLFNGAIDESRGLRRSVVAVVVDTCMDVKLKVDLGPSSSSDTAEYCCTFKATNHGWSSQHIKVDCASVLVKVTWSTLSFMSTIPLVLPPDGMKGFLDSSGGK